MADTYSILQAAKLLGVTDDAIRRRVRRKTLAEVTTGRIAVTVVEAERAALLRKLDAIDARTAATGDCAECRAEVDRLKAVVARLTAADREHLDAIDVLTR